MPNGAKLLHGAAKITLFFFLHHSAILSHRHCVVLYKLYPMATDLLSRFADIRQRSEDLCEPLETEDFVVQPVVDVSPPKWHLAHTTWFFETFLLRKELPNYTEFHPDFNFLFNSYYENVGERTLRPERGFLTRPTVAEVFAYRKHVNKHMLKLLEGKLSKEVQERVELGLQHEQQHQELMLTDLKYILGHNPLFPPYHEEAAFSNEKNTDQAGWVEKPADLYTIGFRGKGFCFDNELGVHQQYLHDYRIAKQLVTNAEYLAFMEAGGYEDANYWMAEGWDWVNTQQIKAPLYWHKIKNKWKVYTLAGLKKMDPDTPVAHVSFYEADAYARWKGLRLPTEFEWEAASPQLHYGSRWEWTGSAYRPYPFFQKAPGAIGEYNGKFMVNQMVLRGSSVATGKDHSRPSYRNFFHANLRWQYTGIRLAEHIEPKR